MTGELLSEADIISRGIIKNVILTLDDGDEHAPSKHWANPNGIRMYYKRKVELAEELHKNCIDGTYYHENADYFNELHDPLQLPYLSFDYTILAEHIADLNNKRRYRSNQDLIKEDLISIANYALPNLNIKNEIEFLEFLNDLQHEASNLFPEPWPKAIARRQIMRKGIMSGKSKAAGLKLLKVLSLMHNQKISTNLISRNSNSLFDILNNCQIIRIDQKIIKSVI
jgi:hypothetical protein